MALEPSLIIQRQRMGDLVMTFPLMGWLRQMEPERPVWVLAEPEFFEALMPFAPDVVFFGPEAEPALRRTPLHRVVNLSHTDAARVFAGSLSAGERLGAFSTGAGTHMEGAWRLYRASIVHNNRHNRLHWSDLMALDLVPHIFMPHTRWPEPRTPDVRGRGRIGLFVGASEPDKRPGPVFWAELAVHLIRRGFDPVFLGGAGDRELAGQAAGKAGIPHSNLAGLFTLEKFAGLLSRLDLLVTPDTGPMHVAAWMRTPTLTLSMGPVNPWETSSPVPGHMALRAEPSCAGCWQCSRPRIAGAPPCHVPFSAKRISAVIHTMMHGRAHRLELPGLRLYRTARDARGLFRLESMDQQPDSARDLLGNFWREMFLELLHGPAPDVETALRVLRGDGERHIPLLVRHTGILLRQLVSGGRSEALWLSVPPLMRPFSGYAQMVWDNGNHTAEAREAVMALIRRILERLTG